jgi:hypothetical protein
MEEAVGQNEKEVGPCLKGLEGPPLIREKEAGLQATFAHGIVIMFAFFLTGLLVSKGNRRVAKLAIPVKII